MPGITRGMAEQMARQFLESTEGGDEVRPTMKWSAIKKYVDEHIAAEGWVDADITRIDLGPKWEKMIFGVNKKSSKGGGQETVTCRITDIDG